VLLTTHYMEEAERLCDRVAIMDHGKVIALGAPRSLSASLGAEHVVEFALATVRRARRAPRKLSALRACARCARGSIARPSRWPKSIAPCPPCSALERRGAELSLLATHHATLEDVFVSLTGRQLRDA